MYATLNTSVYFLQMTVLYPLTLAGAANRVSFLLFSPSPSFTYGLDALGYSLMSLAMLFASPVFVGAGLARRVRWALIANGVLFPAGLLHQNFPVALDVGALWVITFPVATALLVLFFKRAYAESDAA